MKKTAVITIILAFFLILTKVVSAQVLTFDRAYQDYQYNLTIYDQAFSDYEDAKNAYLANQTLALKETARQKTLAMLQDRDTLMAVYLTALRTKIVESTGLSNDDKNNIFGKIDPEVNFYTNHKTQYSDGDDLDTLFAKSSQSENQYKTKTYLIVQESTFDISLGQIAALRIAHEQMFTTLKAQIDAGVAAGTLTLDPFNRWLSDINSTDQLLMQNESTGRNQIAQIYSAQSSFTGGYGAATQTLQSSIQPLGQLNEFLTEVLNYIKSHE